MIVKQFANILPPSCQFTKIRQHFATLRDLLLRVHQQGLRVLQRELRACRPHEGFPDFTNAALKRLALGRSFANVC